MRTRLRPALLQKTNAEPKIHTLRNRNFASGGGEGRPPCGTSNQKDRFNNPPINIQSVGTANLAKKVQDDDKSRFCIMALLYRFCAA